MTKVHSVTVAYSHVSQIVALYLRFTCMKPTLFELCGICLSWQSVKLQVLLTAFCHLKTNLLSFSSIVGEQLKLSVNLFHKSSENDLVNDEQR